MNILREVSDQHLTCSICMDLYQEPKQLPCLHSFCRKCLCTHILKTAGTTGTGPSSFLCPVCRKPCQPGNSDPRQMLEWVESFPDNFYIRGLLDTLADKQRGMGEEPDSQQVQQRLQAMAEETERETCPNHRDQLVVTYCVALEVGVCTLCLKTAVHDKCADKHMSPGEAKAFAGQRLDTFKQRLEKLSERVERAGDKIAARPSDLKFKKEELAIEISKYFSDIRIDLNKIILKKEKEALEELKAVIKRESGKVSGIKDETKALSGSLKSTEQLLDKLLENRPVGALSVTESVESQISSYEKLLCRLETQCAEPDITIAKADNIREVLDQLPWGKLRVGGEEKQESAVSGSVPAGAGSTPPGPGVPSHSKRSTCIVDESKTEGAGRVDSHTQTVRTDNRVLPVASPPEASPRVVHPQINVAQSSPAQQSPVTPTLQPVTPTLQPVSDQSAPTSSDRGFSVTSIHEFNGLNQDDIQNASYVGVCPHGENCLIILDRWNKKLKVVQIGGRILFLFKFTGQMEPWDVTRMAEDRLAVTCPSRCRVLEVEIRNCSMDIVRTVSTSIGYSSLQHLHGHIFAAGASKPFADPHVDILDTCSEEAVIIRVLPVTVTYPRTLGLTLDRNLFICDWSQKDLVVFDSSDFRQLLRYKGTGKAAILREPVSATKDKVGNIYILDRKIKSVLVLSRAGEVLSLLPLGLQCDPKVVVVVDVESDYSSSGEVLVVAAGNGKLYVYSLVHP